MLAVDTSAWIEWLASSVTGQLVEAELPSQDRWIVPTIVQFELAKWLKRELDETRSREVLAFSQKCIVVPLDNGLALTAAEVSRRHRLATADAVIHATAREHGAELLSCDAHFAELPGVRFIRKTAS